MGMPVFVDGRIYFTAGGDVWWGKRQGWLKCVDAGKPDATGPVSETWSYALTKNTCCTPAVADGLVFVADLAGVIHCVDAATGHPYWTHQTAGPFWASPLVADGKVFIGNRRGEFLVLQASKEKRLLSTIDLQSPISATAVAANGVLYVTTMSHLYAIHQPPHP
jgi:outer membrane protein assembly factor BamB